MKEITPEIKLTKPKVGDKCCCFYCGISFIKRSNSGGKYCSKKCCSYSNNEKYIKKAEPIKIISGELWINIVSHPDYYVSSLGRIKKRFVFKSTMREPEFRLISPITDKYGYRRVGLTVRGSSKTFQLHRLIAMAFIDNPNNLPQVNHKNGVKSDNRTENLEWCDAYHNQKHRYDSLHQIAHNRKLNKGQVKYILSTTTKTYKQLSIETNVSLACVKAVKSGRNYSKWFHEFKVTNPAKTH